MSLLLEEQYIRMVASRLERFSQKSNNVFNFRCNICGDSKKDVSKKRGHFHLNKKRTHFQFTCHNCGESHSFSDWLKMFDHSVYQTFVFDIVGGKKETYNFSKSTVDKSEDDDYNLFSDMKPVFKKESKNENSETTETISTFRTSIESTTSECEDDDIPSATDSENECENAASNDGGEETTTEHESMFASGNPFTSRKSASSGMADIDDIPTLSEFESDVDHVKRPSFKDVRTIADLPHDHGARKYLVNRGIPEEYFSKMYFIWRFYAWCNSWKPDSFKQYMVDNFEEPRLIIPFYDKDGQLMMIQGRSFKKDAKIRYFSIKCDDDFPKIFGLEQIDYDKTVQVWEGPIDSMFGENAAAMAGADANPAHYFKDFVNIYDNEPRNSEICKRIQKAIKRGEKVVIWPRNIPEKYDGNDMIVKLGLSREQLNKIIRDNTFQGLEAELKFGEWKKVDFKRKNMVKSAIRKDRYAGLVI